MAIAVGCRRPMENGTPTWNFGRHKQWLVFHKWFGMAHRIRLSTGSRRRGMHIDTQGFAYMRKLEHGTGGLHQAFQMVWLQVCQGRKNESRPADYVVLLDTRRSQAENTIPFQEKIDVHCSFCLVGLQALAISTIMFDCWSRESSL